MITPIKLWSDAAGSVLGTDFWLECAKGTVIGHSAVNKFGRNTDVDTAADEDIWDGGGDWVAPTQARTHDVASSSTNDTSAGTGARTVDVYGLTSWDSEEVSETVTLNGTSNVATANAYVIIHRMECMTFGSGGTNAGAITATAQTDSTVTAQITIGKGQTMMAIYGVPSTQSLYLHRYYSGMNNINNAGNGIVTSLLVNRRPDETDGGFVIKHDIGLYAAGASHAPHDFDPPLAIAGPAIIKMRASDASANNIDVEAGFDAILVDN